MTPSNQCTVCHIGTLQLVCSAYTGWLKGNHLVVVPDVDAWLCDVCGDFFYDPEVTGRIDLLLGNTSTVPHPVQQPTASREASWPPPPSTTRGRGT